MYLNSCKENTYFEITELWFHYEERIEYAKRGIEEGSIVYIVENTKEKVTVASEIKIEDINQIINTSFNRIDAMQICGEPLQKKPKTKSIIKK